MQLFDAATVARFRRIRRSLLIVTVLLAVAAPGVFILGAVGARSGWFGLPIGFDWMALRVAPALGLISAALAILSLLAALIMSPRGGAVLALIAILLGAGVFGGVITWRASLLKSPPVHDVSTDWTTPILFSPKPMLARGADSNPIETNPVVMNAAFSGALAGQLVAVVNARTCPAATPVILTTSVTQAYLVAKSAVMAQHLKIVTDDPGNGVLEATATSPGFGFKDDLALLVRPAGAGARIDMRATSRVGLTDYGRNCRLVTDLRKRMVG